jgi:hypothetical protein
LILLVSLPLVGRGVYGMLRADLASHNCFAQQCQMARFARRFYQGQTLVLNDIGLVSYLADIKLVDIVGLGSNEIARSPGRMDGETLGAVSRREGAKIAIVYPKWLPTNVPSGWTRVGEWELHGIPIALGGRTIVFFATDPSEADPLRRHLEQFLPELPTDVTARVYGREAPILSAVGPE